MSGHREYTQRFKVKVSELIDCFVRWKIYAYYNDML
jgi:hypothetical protein